jgi:WD40 repeat protein
MGSGLTRLLLAACLVPLATRAAAQDEGWVTHHVALSPRQDTVALGSMHAEKGTAWLIARDAARNIEACRVAASGPIRDLSFSADGSRLATTGDNGKVRVHETRGLRLLRELDGHEGWVLSVALSPDGKTVASGGRDKSLRVADVEDGDARWVVRGDRMFVALAFLPDGTGLVSAEHQGPIRLWALAGKGVEIGKEMPLVEHLDTSPDGTRLASAHRNGEVRVWDLRGRKLLWTVRITEGRAYGVCFSPDGKRVAVCGAAPGVRLFATADGSAAAALETERPMIAVRWSERGILAADRDGSMKRWTEKDGAWSRERELSREDR